MELYGRKGTLVINKVYSFLWEDNIRIVCREVGWESMDWTHLAQDRDQWQVFVNMIMNVWIP
jgi:hypothetical protein